MDMHALRNLLERVQKGKTHIEDAMESIREYLLKDLGYATIDNQRQMRVGYPEVIYCEGKTPRQVADIARYMYDHGSDILATRANQEVYRMIEGIDRKADFNPVARTVTIKKKEKKPTDSYIAVVTAGTSDIPVAEEACVTAEFFDNRVERINDVGVAGIHRLLDKLDMIKAAKVTVVAAGMEGALASVIGGLISKPIIAVPTSVGYGASFGGLSALLAMLNSCAAGVAVVNIDNGFGAGYLAGMINTL
jgi:NCAIR mutase (PurE)-related protein